MQSENRLIADMVKVLNGAAGTVTGMSREAATEFQERARARMGGGADMVGRDEFEAVKLMAVAAREENDRLAARLAALEARLGPVR